MRERAKLRGCLEMFERIIMTFKSVIKIENSETSYKLIIYVIFF